MADQNDERHYSDEEFAIILRTASEAPDGFPPALPPEPQDGLTLSEIKAIAAEVGIAPEKVSRAAALLPAGGDIPLMRSDRRWARGTGWRTRFQDVVPTAEWAGSLTRPERPPGPRARPGRSWEEWSGPAVPPRQGTECP